MPSSRQGIPATLEEANWPEIVDRLVKFTLSHLRRVGLGSSRGPIPGGCEPEDFIQEAVQKVLAGERAWKNPQTVSLLDLLMGIIRSDISHRLASFETRMMMRATQLAEEDKANRPANVVDISELIDQRPHSQDAANEIWEESLECVSDDPVLQRLLRLMRDEGLEKARDLAEPLGLSIQEVYNAKKRLKRKLLSLQGPRGRSNPVSAGGMKSD